MDHQSKCCNNTLINLLTFSCSSYFSINFLARILLTYFFFHYFDVAQTPSELYGSLDQNFSL